MFSLSVCRNNVLFTWYIYGTFLLEHSYVHFSRLPQPSEKREQTRCAACTFLGRFLRLLLLRLRCLLRRLRRLRLLLLAPPAHAPAPELAGGAALRMPPAVAVAAVAVAAVAAVAAPPRLLLPLQQAAGLIITCEARGKEETLHCLELSRARLKNKQTEV